MNKIKNFILQIRGVMACLYLFVNDNKITTFQKKYYINLAEHLKDTKDFNKFSIDVIELKKQVKGNRIKIKPSKNK